MISEDPMYDFEHHRGHQKADGRAKFVSVKY